jgi:carboxynorspermidine decarboxylase (EC 4.1.1.-)
MPDVLAMPYSPDIINAGAEGEKKNTYRLRGLTCLAGDIIGDYSFEDKLKPRDKIVFLDMALYTMVKTTTFNGVRLPSILFFNSKSGEIELVKRFGFEAYKEKLS